MVHISDIRVGVGEVEESSFSTGQILAGVGGAGGVRERRS